VFISTLLLTVCLLCTTTTALDFEITKVIEVGPMYGGAGINPVQWSPDGTKLAYFNDGYLMLADTLGNTEQVAEIDLPPRRFVWVSNNEVMVYQRRFMSDGYILDRMSLVIIETGGVQTLENIKHGRWENHSPREFWGPFLTVEGNAFYYVTVEGARSIQMAPSLPAAKATPEHNHIIRAGEDALYTVQVDFKDSTQIFNKRYGQHRWHHMIGVYLSKDRTHVISGGTITRLVDNKKIILDTLSIVQDKPEGTVVCGFGAVSLNPKFTEVAFRLSCDDGESYSIDRMGVFDYSTYEFTILDSLVGLSNCTRPTYAPDGMRMAFLSKGNVYILNREMK